MARFELNADAFAKLQQAMKNFPTGAGYVIDEVLHTEGGSLIEEEIRRLMPVSNVTWKGKKPSAKTGNSLTQENHTLGVTIRTTPNYHYLYFPDDGTTTKRHIGNQQFFFRGAEETQDEIIDRCVNRLVEKIEQLK